VREIKEEYLRKRNKVTSERSFRKINKEYVYSWEKKAN
jgi:hypothetical protein